MPPVNTYPAVKQKDAPRGDKWQQGLCLLALGFMDAHDTSGDGKTPEDIVGRGNQTVRIMTTSFMWESTFGIELMSYFLCCRQIILGAIEGDDRHRVPQIGGIPRIEAIGELNGLVQDVPENRPTDLLPSFGEAASMDLIGFGPQAASPGSLEEFPRFDVHSLALSTADEGQDKDDELGKGKLASAGEIADGSLGFGSNFFWNKVQKTCEDWSNVA